MRLLIASALLLGGCVLVPGYAAKRSARLTAFEGVLAEHDSATAALSDWCGTRHLAETPQITARSTKGTNFIPPEVYSQLRVQSVTQLHYRHVQLSCGNRVLSNADNWYIPALLTPAMNQALASGNTPFGKVVTPLGFRRERLSSQRGRGEGCPRGTILTHRALLRLPDGRPLAYVVECYTRANLSGGN